VERSENVTWNEDDEPAIASSPFSTSAQLLAAIHRGDERAIGDLFLLYAPLLRDQARRMSIAPDERNEFVMTVLDDLVLHLIESRIAPRHLTRYLVAALRNRARNHHRDSGRRLAMQDSAYATQGIARERIVAECHSEYGLRVALPADATKSALLRSAMTRLAERCARDLTSEEMTMLVGVGRHVPLRDVADQLGVSYGAARVRLHRLRERFRKLAIEYMESLKSDERSEIERFFRRAELRSTESASQEEVPAGLEPIRNSQEGRSK
jgi:DNA-directed RNA polymerase specialized sigma24 family protein